jgi:hypothetical protein
VVREDEVRLSLTANRVPTRRHFASSSTSRTTRRIVDDAVADDAGDAGMQMPTVKRRTNRAVDVYGMTGVVRLIPGDDIEARRQQIDDLALAFITPLSAKHTQIHNRSWFFVLRSSFFVRRTTLDVRRCRTHDSTLRR